MFLRRESESVARILSDCASHSLLLCFVTRLVFTVVSDPSEDDDDEGDCVDVANASVDFIQVCALLHCSILVLSYFSLDWFRWRALTSKGRHLDFM